MLTLLLAALYCCPYCQHMTCDTDGKANFVHRNIFQSVRLSLTLL
jgi:hypothetical protein